MIPGRRADAARGPTEVLVRELEEVAGEPPWAILLFGSRLAGTAPDRHSAYDLVLVVDEYGPFYRRLHRAGKHGRSPRILTALSHVLAPNVISFDPGLPEGPLAKVMVLTPADFARALSPRPPDHFLVGRLVQRVEILQARDEAVRQEIEALLARARRGVLEWAAPWLPERFDAADVVRTMLEVSYAGEVRPESAGRVAAVFEAQRERLEPLFRRVLQDAEREGTVSRADQRPESGPAWRLTRPPSQAERLRWRLYFARSKIRATSRWLKHVLTFDDWITYIQRKVERRTGMHVEVTPMERRLPLILLWPKVFRVLGELRRERTARRTRSGGHP